MSARGLAAVVSLALIVGAVGFLPAGPRPARASFPGENGLIAYTGYLSNPEYHGEIFTVDPDSLETVNLTNTPSSEENNPAWSPDGSRIVYRRGNELWVMNADGSDSHPIPGAVGGSDPAWSPDGRMIVYETSEQGGSLMIISVDGGMPYRVASAPSYGLDGGPSWSPDCGTIAFVTSGATFTLIDPTGANPQILELNGYGPTWSPEGDRIAYTSAGVSVIDVTTREITAIPVFGESPAWSPDGEFVAFTRLPVGQEGQNIYTARLDGSDERKLTTGEQNLWPDWQPIPGNRQPADCDFSLPASDQLPAGGGRPDGSPARNATMPFLPGLALMFASALWIAWQLRRQPNSPTGK